jgi:hypothetical protein
MESKADVVEQMNNNKNKKRKHFGQCSNQCLKGDDSKRFIGKCYTYV